MGAPNYKPGLDLEGQPPADVIFAETDLGKRLLPYYDALAGQLYHFIRLNPDKHGAAPLRRVAYRVLKLPEKPTDPKAAPWTVRQNDIDIRANIFLRDRRTGQYRNAKTLVRVEAVDLFAGQVIYVGSMLGKLDTDDAVSDYRKHFTPLANGDLGGDLRHRRDGPQDGRGEVLRDRVPARRGRGGREAQRR